MSKAKMTWISFTPTYKCAVCGRLIDGRVAHRIQSYRAKDIECEADAMLEGIISELIFPAYAMPPKFIRHLCSILSPTRPPSVQGGYARCDIVGVQVGGLIEQKNEIVNELDSQILQNLRDHVLPKLRTVLKQVEDKKAFSAHEGLNDAIEIVKTLCDGKGLYVESGT